MKQARAAPRAGVRSRGQTTEDLESHSKESSGRLQHRKGMIKSGFSVAHSGSRQRLDEEGKGQRQV